MKSFGAHSFPLEQLQAMDFGKLKQLAALFPHTEHFDGWLCVRCVIDKIIEERTTPNMKAVEIANWIWFETNPDTDDNYYGTSKGYDMLIDKIEKAIVAAKESK